MDWTPVLDWLRTDNSSNGSDLLMQFAATLMGLVAGWFLWLRRALDSRKRLRKAETDNLSFQMHVLQPLPGGADEWVLLFRNIVPSTTVEALYENPAARSLVRSLAKRTTVQNPILQTSGSSGFDVLNDAFAHAAGYLAISPHPKEEWLFAMTCEDRQAVRRACVRCFLIRSGDLQRFLDWNWCRNRVRVEEPWHWFRVVALHQMALLWREQELEKKTESGTGMPLVDKHSRHVRVRAMSAGLNTNELCVREPCRIPWEAFEQGLRKLGLDPDTGTVLKS